MAHFSSFSPPQHGLYATIIITLHSEDQCTVASLLNILNTALTSMATSVGIYLEAFRALFTAVLSGGTTCDVPGRLNAHLDFDIVNNCEVLFDRSKKSM